MDLESAIREAAVRLEAQDLDAFEVFGVSESSLVAEAKQQMVELFVRAESRGICVRAASKGRMGFSATTDISARTITQLVQSALASMRRVAPSSEAVLPGPQGSMGVIEEAQGRSFSEVPDDEKVRLAMLLESAAMAADSRVSRVQHPRYEERITTHIVLNSHGVDVISKRGLASCELKVVADGVSGPETAYEFDFSAGFDRLDPEGIANIAARRAVARLGACPIKGGSMTAIFDPRAASSLVRLLAPSFFADNVQRGKSMLAGKLRQKAFNPAVSIVDDGLLPHGFGSFPFDAEGIPKRRTVMVRDGIVESWLYDGARAARDKANSTGNACREGLRKPPSIGVGNCFLKAGVSSPANLVRQVDNGVLVTSLLGVHTANPVSGSFSFGMEGFRIENGVCGDPIRGMTIAGNVHDLFMQSVVLGSDLEFFGAYGAPSILVEDVMVGG